MAVPAVPGDRARGSSVTSHDAVRATPLDARFVPIDDQSATAHRARHVAPQRTSRRDGRSRRARRQPSTNASGLAPVYDVDGPRVRYGIAWFLVAAPAVALSPFSAGVVYAAAGGLGGRQVVRSWRLSGLQGIVAAAAVAATVLAAAWGSASALIALLVGGTMSAVVGFMGPTGALGRAPGRVASTAIMLQAVVPLAVGCGAMVLLRGESEVVAVILFAMVCAYEVGDFLMGSGSWTALEGPLAGGLAFILVGFPAVLLVLEPFDVLGAWVLVAAALACPVGQWIASAVLPRPDATAAALRRVDTLLVVAPLWVIANAAF